MTKLIGYARVSTKSQTTDRQVSDLLAAGVRRDDVYFDHGVSGGGCPYVLVKRRVGGRFGRGCRRGAWRRGRRSVVGRGR